MASMSTLVVLALAFLGFESAGIIGRVEAAGPDVSKGLQDVLNKAHQGPLYDYPTSFTQGIVPVSLNAEMVWR